jgi:transcriptional regulator with XRE-family HTH domain
MGIMNTEAFRFWLSEEINRRGWSRREFGRRAGLTSSFISKILLGKQTPTISFYHKTAQALSIPPETVLQVAGILSPVPPADPDDDSTLREIVELTRNMSPEDRQQILDYVRFVYHRRKG